MSTEKVAPTLLRSAASVVGLLAVYALLPLDGSSRAALVARCVLGAGGAVVLLVWQFRRLLRSDRPHLAVIEVLAVGVPLVVLGFAATYAVVSQVDDAAFTEPLDHVGALYLSMTTTTTVGFGDIAPLSDTARIITMLHMVANVVLLGVAARELMSRARSRRS